MAKNLVGGKQKNLASSQKKNRDKKFSQKPERAAAFIFVLFLLLSSFSMVFLVFRDNRSFEIILQEIDRIQRREAAPLRLYRDVVAKARSEHDYLRILKRVYQIRDQESHNKSLLTVSEKATAELPASENLRAYHLVALLESGRFPEAVSVSENLESSRYLPLKAEVLIQSLAIAQEVAPDLSIATVVHASAHDAALYINLSRLFREPRFAWNAALLYMFRGERDKALRLVRELQNEPWLNKFAAGQIAYDNQNWQLAAALLETAPQDGKTLQYLADIYALQQDYEKIVDVLGRASDWLNQSAEIGKENSAETWQLYYNLALAYQELGQNDWAFEVLWQARSSFPHSTELLLLMNMLAPPDEKEYAKSVLAEFISKDSNEEPSLVLASLVFAEERNNQQKFRSKLWGLFSKFPSYERILNYLLWYYIGLNRTEEVDLALDRYRNLVLAKENRDFPSWANEYMAINASLKKDFSRAKNLFSDLVNEKPHWHNYYNIANVHVYEGDVLEAVRQLRKALELAEDVASRLEIYYRIVTLTEGTGENYLSVAEELELDGMLRNYVLDNYNGAHWGSDILRLKTDSLLSWRKANGSEILDDPEQYRREMGEIERPRDIPPPPDLFGPVN